MFSGYFSKVFILLVSFVLLLQVACEFNAASVDDVVSYCQNKVSELAATERKYARAPRKLGEPVTFGELIPELLRIINRVDQNQRVFECIGDILNGYSEQYLRASEGYKYLEEKCILERPIDPKCDDLYPYSTVNGTCNNLKNPKWGSTLHCFRRLFPANYEGSSGIRKSVNGKELPLPRTLSLNIMLDRHRPSNEINNLFVFFGQLLSHDLNQIIFSTIDSDKVLFDCCAHAGKIDQHPQCEPILLSNDDPFYSLRKVSCLNLVRSAPCYTCSVGNRLQINQVTSYIDSSITYGQTDDRAKNLRRNDGTGKLISQYRGDQELLPEINSLGKNRCSRGRDEDNQYCLRSGDTRTNQQALIAMFQTLLLREHNRIADILKKLNPDWMEEKIFQETRKIVIAETQVITYKEFLPVVLGKDLMSIYKLNVGSGGFYDPKIDASISIEFNAAGFRLHSLIPGKVVSGEVYNDMKCLFVNVAPIYNNRTTSYLRKMAEFRAEKYDWFMPRDLTDFLYRERYGSYGYDLAAFDILRGRDLGLPTYAQVIEYFEGTKRTITKFDDLKGYLVPECLMLLEENYYDVRDVDLLVGLNCEQIPDDMIISPTAAKITAEQFQRLKFGDRFYFEFDDTLTDEQKIALLSTSLAKMICDNTDLSQIQENAMILPSTENLILDCSKIPSVNLESWKECS